MKKGHAESKIIPNYHLGEYGVRVLFYIVDLKIKLSLPQAAEHGTALATRVAQQCPGGAAPSVLSASLSFLETSLHLSLPPNMTPAVGT